MTGNQTRALVWGGVFSLVAGDIGLGVYFHDPVVKTTHYPDRARTVNTTVGCYKPGYCRKCGMGMANGMTQTTCGMRISSTCPGRQDAVAVIVPVEKHTKKGEVLWDSQQRIIERKGVCR